MAGDLRDISERLFAACYPWLAARAERAGLGAIRARLLAGARGRTLEVGAGHGANLPHYPPAVAELVLSEPSAPMHQRLVAAAVANRDGAAVIQAGLDGLPFGAAVFDTVVCTLVLCSVDDPCAAVAEIARVLAPGGRLLFLEHVRAPERSALARAQDLVAVPHRLAAAGCRPNRRTEALLTDPCSPLRVEWLERGAQPSALPFVRPIILGCAICAS